VIDTFFVCSNEEDRKQFGIKAL